MSWGKITRNNEGRHHKKILNRDLKNLCSNRAYIKLSCLIDAMEEKKISSTLRMEKRGYGGTERKKSMLPWENM